jgi:transposase
VTEIERKTGVSERSQRAIRKKAYDRGFRPEEDPRILESYVIDGIKSGRPKEISKDKEEALLAAVRSDRSGREKSSEVLGYEQDISQSSALRILKNNGLTNVKPTTKPGLTAAMRKIRFEWALAHANWTLEDWKNVIWSDETSVVLGHRRGAVRVWRASNEAYDSTVVRRRWKGFSEFMWWSCFSWDRKGPCHIWRAQTDAERKKDDLELAKLNEQLEITAKAEWELSTALRRINLQQNPRGRKPQWRWNQSTGKLVRKSKNGIDFWRYYKEIMLPKLIPFAQECQKERPDTLVQEDKAPAHDHHHQGPVYDLHHITRLLWPGNSPDLNAIEPCWPWMKKTTTARGAPSTKATMETAWIQAWSTLPQSQIQAWIERIPRHVQEIIRLEGGNEYAEGRKAFKRDQAGIRLKGKLSKHTYLDAQGQGQDQGQDQGQGKDYSLGGIATRPDGWQDATDIESDLDIEDSDETDSD